MSVQSYYTKPKLAASIRRLLSNLYNEPDTIALDPCAGEGNLLSVAFFSDRGRAQCIAVEPKSESMPSLIQFRKRHGARLFHMTAEEYALTHAQPDACQLYLCNPPFGPRLGRTQCGESVRELHLPQCERFETYFFTLGAAVAQQCMVFLIPDSYFRHAEAEPTLNRLANAGWDLRALRKLPIDGYENALVNTSLWILIRDPQVAKNWVQPALEMLRNGWHPPLHLDAVTITKRGIHGEVTGYLLKPVKRVNTARQSFSDKAWQPVAVDPLDWTPEPKKLGAMWQRMGCMYELTEMGWRPANRNGYAQGKPVTHAFEKAQRAFQFQRQGAVRTARWLLKGVDLKALRKAYGDLAAASFLQMLAPGQPEPDALKRDLEVLGMIEIDERDLALLEPAPPILVLERHVALPDKLTVAQLADLFLTYGKDCPEALKDRLTKELWGRAIPVERCKLRSAWLPKRCVGEATGFFVDARGLFVPKNNWKYSKSIEAYLNYGKGRHRIGEGDEEIYEATSQRFALYINEWRDDNLSEMRLTVHAAYVRAHEDPRMMIDRATQVQPAKPLHWYQKEDLPFLVSGQAICNWDVGVGKTFGGIAAAMAYPGKALIAVPKPVVTNWAREIKTFFPQARFEVLGFRKSKRGGKYLLDIKNLISQAGRVFFDPNVKIILTTHQVLARIKVHEQDIAEADERDAFDWVGDSDKETAKKRREAYIQKAAVRNYLFDGEFTFTDLPLSNLLLIVDEGHAFKGLLPMPSSGWGESLVMAGNCGESKRARDLKIKLDLLREAGGSTLCLTATPVNNAVVEIFNMMRLFCPQTLDRRGLRNPQQFIDTYCQMKSITAVTLTGKILTGRTIHGFYNTADLRAMFQEAMVTRTAEDAKLKLPEVREEIIRIEPTSAMANFLYEQKKLLGKTVLKFSEEKRQLEKHEVCIFEIIHAIDSLASFPPLVGVADNPKGEELTAKVLDIYHGGSGGQIIFSDRLESHQAIRDMLVQGNDDHPGIPESEIVILNADTAPDIDKRLTIQDQFNSGACRVVIGGQVASEGLNLQKKLTAIHFNNLGWNSQAIHQRKGRGVRQGNPNPYVDIYYYLLNGSTDIYRFATTQNKAHWWEAVRRAQTDAVTENVFSQPIDDEMIASLSNNPEKTLAVLMERRRLKEIEIEMDQYHRLLRRMLQYADPQRRSVCLPFLQMMEHKLRQLQWIPQDVLDEAVRRVEQVALLQAKLYGESRRNWDVDVLNLSRLRRNDLSLTVNDLFQLKDALKGSPALAMPLAEMVHWKYRDMIAEAPVTYGKPALLRPEAEESQCARSIVVKLGETESEAQDEPATIQAAEHPGEARQVQAARVETPSMAARYFDAARHKQAALFDEGAARKPKTPAKILAKPIQPKKAERALKPVAETIPPAQQKPVKPGRSPKKTQTPAAKARPVQLSFAF